MLKLVRPEDLLPSKGAKKSQSAAALTLEEKQRMLADIVQLNVMDYFNEDGSFDVPRARRCIPSWCLQEFTVNEVTRTDRSGNETTTRKIRLRVVDKLKALDMHSDLMGHKDSNADEPSPEEKAKQDEEYRAAQLRAKELIKQKLLGPDWPEKMS